MQIIKQEQKDIKTLNDLARFVNYSFVNTLNADPNAKLDGIDHKPREVFSGHYVPVMPTPIPSPIYIAHSKIFFKELGFDDALALSEDFIRLFSGDTSHLPSVLSRTGWATGYALSIYGTQYYEQCPFGTGNGYGDGRAISILEVVIKDKRWEMQLKGGGKTPYCRGADGRAVLRSSVREFLAQEHMHALGIPTSRSLALYTSKKEKVKRPWFLLGSYSKDPEVMIQEDVAITTRVAPSFIRVGQLELFARRSLKNEHTDALQELKMIVLHVIDREYSDVIDSKLSFEDKIVLLAREFRSRLTMLVANWIRVGYCQGNFNSDNCSVGGFTLDYGPFGWVDMFDPKYQPWTGGGIHFSFLNQPQAAERNFHMFYISLKPLLELHRDKLNELDEIRAEFPKVMQTKMIQMWTDKLGLPSFDVNLFNELIALMKDTRVDYTIFFRELSNVPERVEALTKSFYGDFTDYENMLKQWSNWLHRWRLALNVNTPQEIQNLSNKMKQINPKYTLREWFLVPAYIKAQQGDYTPIKTLQDIMTNPYEEQSTEVQEKYYIKKPTELFDIAGISHVSCSS